MALLEIALAPVILRCWFGAFFENLSEQAGRSFRVCTTFLDMVRRTHHLPMISVRAAYPFIPPDLPRSLLITGRSAPVQRHRSMACVWAAA